MKFDEINLAIDTAKQVLQFKENEPFYLDIYYARLLSKQFLAAMEKIEELEKKLEYQENWKCDGCEHLRLEQKNRISELEACLAEKDKSLVRCLTTIPLINFINPDHKIFLYCIQEEAFKAIFLNPNQYQERARARERVIEAARKQAYMGSFIDGPGKELQDALACLDKTEVRHQ